MGFDFCWVWVGVFVFVIENYFCLIVFGKFLCEFLYYVDESSEIGLSRLSFFD